MTWSISVKTVGSSNIVSRHEQQGLEQEVDSDVPSRLTSNNDTNTSTLTADKPKPTDFTLEVKPDDSVSSLHKQIEDITGLRASQQRLIYRGRLIGGSVAGSGENEGNKDAKIRDVEGLSDGQTIHLVPRPAEADNANSNGERNASESSGSGNTSTGSDGGTTVSGQAGAGLLAALLGIGAGNLSSGGGDDESHEDEENEANVFTLPRTRAARSSARRRRINSHLRTADDPRYPEPGSLEPVRQGLMTLHTMIGSLGVDLDGDLNAMSNTANTMANTAMSNTANTVVNTVANNNVTRQSEDQLGPLGPLRATRKWYRGQWIDCRDTVNQWLEATVVEVVSPGDILITSSTSPSTSSSSSNASRNSTPFPAMDAAIGANDFDGRRLLLLEPHDDPSNNTLANLNGDENLTGYRERANNHNVQLLLVHYNGWPHRWDEWIRSDSERIRPFRTRSRHHSHRSPHSNPAPQSVFHAAPPTHVRGEVDFLERRALLPEIQRVIHAVERVFGQALPNGNSNIVETKIADHVPNGTGCASGSSGATGSGNEHANSSTTQIPIIEPQLPWRTQSPSATDNDSDNEHHDASLYNKKQLEALAPLLDRLGRVLTDAAPHVAAVAESLPDTVPSEHSNGNDLCRDSHSRSDENKVDGDDDNDNDNEDTNDNDNENDTARRSEDQASFIPFSQGSRSRSLRPFWSSGDASVTTPLLSSNANASNNANANERDSSTTEEQDTSNSNNDLERAPDYVDFVNGFVNAPGGAENSSSTARSSARRSNREEVSATNLGTSLLSAYLASNGLGGNNTNNNNNDNDETTPNNNDTGTARIVRLGGGGNGGGMAGNLTGNSNGGGGIDIHIHAIVTGPGGAGGAAALGGLGGLGGLAGLLNTATTPAFSNTFPSAATSTTTASSTTNNSSTARIPVISEDEDDLGLFSDLYTDTPPATDVRNTFHRDEDVGAPPGPVSGSQTNNNTDNDEYNDDTDELEDIPPLDTIDNTNTADNNLPAPSPTNQTSVSNGPASSTNSITPSREPSDRDSDNDTNTSDSNGSGSNSPRRTSSLSRLFRRALGRRPNSNNNM